MMIIRLLAVLLALVASARAESCPAEDLSLFAIDLDTFARNTDTYYVASEDGLLFAFRGDDSFVDQNLNTLAAYDPQTGLVAFLGVFGGRGAFSSSCDGRYRCDGLAAALPGGGIIFSAERSTSENVGTEVYESDGTVAGTRLVADLNPGSDSSNPSGFVVEPVSGNVFFIAAADGTNKRVFVRTAAGPVFQVTGDYDRVVTDGLDYGSSTLPPLHADGAGTVYFTASPSGRVMAVNGSTPLAGAVPVDLDIGVTYDNSQIACAGEGTVVFTAEVDLPSETQLRLVIARAGEVNASLAEGTGALPGVYVEGAACVGGAALVHSTAGDSGAVYAVNLTDGSARELGLAETARIVGIRAVEGGSCAGLWWGDAEDDEIFYLGLLYADDRGLVQIVDDPAVLVDRDPKPYLVASPSGTGDVFFVNSVPVDFDRTDVYVSADGNSTAVSIAELYAAKVGLVAGRGPLAGQAFLTAHNASGVGTARLYSVDVTAGTAAEVTAVGNITMRQAETNSASPLLLVPAGPDRPFEVTDIRRDVVVSVSAATPGSAPVVERFVNLDFEATFDQFKLRRALLRGGVVLFTSEAGEEGDIQRLEVYEPGSGRRNLTGPVPRVHMPGREDDFLPSEQNVVPKQTVVPFAVQEEDGNDTVSWYLFNATSRSVTPLALPAEYTTTLSGYEDFLQVGDNTGYILLDLSAYGLEWHVFDLSDPGGVRVIDTKPGADGVGYQLGAMVATPLLDACDVVGFMDVDSEVGTELYCGNSTHFSLVRDLTPGSDSSVPSRPHVHSDGFVLFAGQEFTSAGSADGIYRTDGTDAGTVRLSVDSGSLSTNFVELDGGNVLFVYRRFTYGDLELYMYDRANDTVVLAPVDLGNYTIRGGVGYFDGGSVVLALGSDGVLVTDGTAEGSSLVASPAMRSALSGPVGNGYGMACFRAFISGTAGTLACVCCGCGVSSFPPGPRVPELCDFGSCSEDVDGDGDGDGDNDGDGAGTSSSSSSSDVNLSNGELAGGIIGSLVLLGVIGVACFAAGRSRSGSGNAASKTDEGPTTSSSATGDMEMASTSGAAQY